MFLYQTFYSRTVFVEKLFVAFRYWTRYDKRRTCVVYQYAIDLVDNGIVVHTLYKVERRGRHIITQVVETEFVVRTEGNVGIVCLSAFFGVGLVLVDTVYRQPVEHIQRSHPFGVALRQIIVHRNHVYTVACQCVEEYGQRCHESFTFTRCHFGYLAFVQHYAAE